MSAIPPIIKVEFNGVVDTSQGFSAAEEAEEDEEEEENSEEKRCLTFRVDILSAQDMEDVTSNCLTEDRDKGQQEDLPLKICKRSEGRRRSLSFHTSSKEKRPVIPRLQLPNEDYDDDIGSVDPTPHSAKLAPSSGLEENHAQDSQPLESVKKPRKRRRSIVNLLFPKGSSNSPPPEDLLTPSTPNLDTTGFAIFQFARLISSRFLSK